MLLEMCCATEYLFFLCEIVYMGEETILIGNTGGSLTLCSLFDQRPGSEPPCTLTIDPCLYIIADYMHLLPKEMIPEIAVKFKEIIPISARTGERTEELIMCLRKVLDEEAEKRIEEYQKKQLSALHLSSI